MSEETPILVPNQCELNKVAQKYGDMEHRLRSQERHSDQKAALEKAIEETTTNIQVGHLSVVSPSKPSPSAPLDLAKAIVPLCSAIGQLHCPLIQCMAEACHTRYDRWRCTHLH